MVQHHGSALLLQGSPTGVFPHLYIPPAWVVIQPEVHVVLQGDGQAVHEGGAGGDGVGVKYLAALFLGDVDALLEELLAQPLLLFLLQQEEEAQLCSQQQTTPANTRALLALDLCAQGVHDTLVKQQVMADWQLSGQHDWVRAQKMFCVSCA